MRTRSLLFQILFLVAVAARLSAEPLVAVGTRTFSSVNVEIVGIAVRPAQSTEFVALPMSGSVIVNLLGLTNDLQWSGISSIPTGNYDAIRLSVNPATVSLTDTSSETELAVLPDGAAELTFLFTPALRIDAVMNAVLVRWIPDESLRFDSDQNVYVVAPSLTAFPLNFSPVPVSVQSLVSRVVGVNPATGELRITFDPLSASWYVIRTTAATAIRDGRGRLISLSSVKPGDVIGVTGTLDSNTDITATRIVVSLSGV